jgi:phage/conjugal plasmid C-4 type zinc finger TraR family protein
MNAVAEVRRKLEKQAQEPSLSECEECGEDIPVARQLAIPGVKLCILCKEAQEKRI